MNKNRRLLILLIGVTLGSITQSCRSNKNEPAAYSLETGCFYQNFTYIGSLTDTKATIVKTEQGAYDLSTQEPFVIDTTKYQLLNACNLPEPLKVVGKQVLITGRVYKDTRIIPNYLVIGQPFVLSKVTNQ
jgi:hypothetical protein